MGWITPTTGVTARDVGGVRFLPIVPSVTACLAELKQQHPDLDFVIGLSHSGEWCAWVAPHAPERPAASSHPHPHMYTALCLPALRLHR